MIMQEIRNVIETGTRVSAQFVERIREEEIQGAAANEDILILDGRDVHGKPQTIIRLVTQIDDIYTAVSDFYNYHSQNATTGKLKVGNTLYNQHLTKALDAVEKYDNKVYNFNREQISKNNNHLLERKVAFTEKKGKYELDITSEAKKILKDRKADDEYMESIKLGKKTKPKLRNPEAKNQKANDFINGKEFFKEISDIYNNSLQENERKENSQPKKKQKITLQTPIVKKQKVKLQLPSPKENTERKQQEKKQIKLSTISAKENKTKIQVPKVKVNIPKVKQQPEKKKKIDLYTPNINTKKTKVTKATGNKKPPEIKVQIHKPKKR